MPSTISLFKSFAASMVDYITRHNSNYTLIENAINDLVAVIGGASGGLAVSEGLKQIFDRRGLIGVDSYDFDEGTYPAEELDIAAGAYWNGADFMSKTTTTTLDLAGWGTGTIYINIDAGGNPSLSSTATTNTTRQFAWNATSKVVSSKALYTGVNILFDGDDYNACLDSDYFDTTYSALSDRLAAIENLLATMGGYYGKNYIDGLNFYYRAGTCRDSLGQAQDTPAGSKTCTDDQTNYLELDAETGTVYINTTGVTPGRVGLWKLVAASGAITVETDLRTWAFIGGGSGGGAGSGGHVQGTDQGTTHDDFLIDSDYAGGSAGHAGISVEGGAIPDGMLHFFRDSQTWKYSVDGGASWEDLTGFEDYALGQQELNKLVMFDNPTLVLEDLARSSSSAYEDLDLDSYITHPQGAAAVILRVLFWDSEDPASTDNHVKFRKKDIVETPAVAYTVYGPSLKDTSRPQMLIVECDENHEIQFWVEASGTGTANVRVYLLGYYAKVTGVGTQYVTKTPSAITVAASDSEEVNRTSFMNRGLVHKMLVEETGGNVTDTYDIEIFSKDTFLDADLLYAAEGIDPTADSRVFTDALPWFFIDADASSELHVRITNNDSGQSGTWEITIYAEQFA